PIPAESNVAASKNCTSNVKPPDVHYYTCTMHPSVKKMNPKDKCPICSMDLVPVKKKGAAAPTTPSAASEAPSEFTVPVARQQQIGVTYANVEKKQLRHTIRTVGLVEYDKQRHWDYVARVEGYVQKLNVASRGELVKT